MILTCDHRDLGLCESCRAAYEEDPQAFEAELQAEAAAEPAPEPYGDHEIPF